MDLSATRPTKRLLRYHDSGRHPDAFGIHAMAISVTTRVAYVYPPAALLLRVPVGESPPCFQSPLAPDISLVPKPFSLTHVRPFLQGSPSSLETLVCIPARLGFFGVA